MIDLVFFRAVHSSLALAASEIGLLGANLALYHLDITIIKIITSNFIPNLKSFSIMKLGHIKPRSNLNDKTVPTQSTNHNSRI